MGSFAGAEQHHGVGAFELSPGAKQHRGVGTCDVIC